MAKSKKMIKGMERASKKVGTASRASAASGGRKKGAPKTSKGMVKGMEKASRTGGRSASRGGRLPKKGDVLHCNVCGMEIEITTSCSCDDPKMVRLECCGQKLVA